jgi:oligopeptide transport system substrate-binding protein
MIDRALWGLLLGLGIAVGAILLSLSAGRPEPAAFRFVNGTEPRTLDPARMTGAPEGRIANAIFEGLTTRDPATLAIAPGTAERWEISPDSTRYTFFIRPSARWSDGSPVTAHDFAFAWRRLLAPDGGSEYAYILHALRDAEAFNVFPARADALATTVGPALERFVAEEDPRAWPDFVATSRLTELLSASADPELRALLRAERAPRAERVSQVLQALAREAERLRGAAAAAASRLGVSSGVFARDAGTLVVELERPVPYFLELTSFFPTFPVKREIVSRPEIANRWYLPEHIVGNGAFRLRDWIVGDVIRLERSDTYWNREAIALDAVDALPVESAHAALNLYLSGAVQWLPGLYPAELVDELRARDDFYSGAGMIVYFYRFNTKKPPLDDPRVRHALALAVDRESIVRDVLRLGQLPAHHLVPPGMPGYRPPESELHFDVDRARALLAEAGFPEGRGFPTLGLLFNTSEMHKQLAEVVVDGWRKHLGIDVRAYNQEWQAYLASVNRGDFDIARAGWIGDYRDPNTFLDLFVSSGGNNQTGWGDPRYDALIDVAGDPDRALREPSRLQALLPDERSWQLPPSTAEDERNRALRMASFREAERLLVAEAFPVMPLYFYVVSGLVAPSVRGFHAEIVLPDGTTGPNLQDLHPLWALSVSTGEGR